MGLKILGDGGIRLPQHHESKSYRDTSSPSPSRRKLCLFSLLLLALLSTFFLSSKSARSHISNLSNHFMHDQYSYYPVDKNNFHLIVPATESNTDLCKLIASAAALDYPTPILVNWEGSQAHLQKVVTVLAYLNGLPSEADNDVALIIDGYDIWFQLRPDVMLGRYFDVVDAANRRLELELGADVMQKHGIYQSIVFGQDKICWPEDPARPACWLVPESTLPTFAFGPETDSGRFRQHNRPRWLNSGTIMGPVKDLRKFYVATLEKIGDHPDSDSDQRFMSDVWADQEYARLILRDGPLKDRLRRTWVSDGWMGEGHFEDIYVEVPDIKPGKDVEYHITIDYDSSLFLAMSYYHNFVDWLRHDENMTLDNLPDLGDWSAPNQALLDLPEDILLSPPPFPPMDAAERDRTTGRPMSELNDLGWADISLGQNLVSNQIFPLIHFTGPKIYREWWWERMWFARYARAILNATPEAAGGPVAVAGSRQWWNLELPLAIEAGRGGVVTDTNTALPWGDVCGAYEDETFHMPWDPLLASLEVSSKDIDNDADSTHDDTERMSTADVDMA